MRVSQEGPAAASIASLVKLVVPSVLSLPRPFCVMARTFWPARACAPCDCGPSSYPLICLVWTVFVPELLCLKLPAAHAHIFFCLVPSWLTPTLMPHAPAGARRNLRQRVDDQGRNVRTRVEDLETRMDAAEAQARAHDSNS